MSESAGGAQDFRVLAIIRGLPEDLRKIIALLLRNPDGLWFNEIYRRLRREIGSPTTLSKKLKRLVKMGIVRRGRGPQRKSVYRLSPWFFDSFHRIVKVGVPGLTAREEAFFLRELPFFFVSAKEVADRIEWFLSHEVAIEEVAEALGIRAVGRYKCKPEEEDIEVLAGLLWLLRSAIDVIARVLVLGHPLNREEKALMMAGVERFLHALSKNAGKVDIVKWADIWLFLNDEWLRHYIALFNWLTPKIEGKEYPEPIVTAVPEEEAITPFGIGWMWTMIMLRDVLSTAAFVLTFPKEEERERILRMLSEEIERLRREKPELLGTEEGKRRLREILKRRIEETRAEKAG